MINLFEKNCRELWFLLISCILWTVLIFQFDPFGIKTATSIQSESIILRLIGGPWYQSTVQKKITVILIDDNYVNETDQRWPMSYIQHDFLLNDILDFEPKAVFYDVLFKFNHEAPDTAGLRQLKKTMREKEGETPIFVPRLVGDIGSTSSCGPDISPIDTEKINQLVSGIIFGGESNLENVYVGWKGCSNRYPSFIMHNEQFRTPAFAMYQTICKEYDDFAVGCSSLKTASDIEGVKTGCIFSKSGKRIEKDILKPFIKPMMVRWGSGVTEEHQSSFKESEYGKGCKVFNNKKIDSLDRLTYSGLQLLYMTCQSYHSNTERGKAEHCTYTDTLHATWFLEPPSEELYDHLNHMIKDRIVLIGTQIDGVNDYVLSPVNDNVPGVYLHAMALDNYLEYGSVFFHPMSKAGSFAIELLVVLVGNFMYFLVLVKYTPKWKGSWGEYSKIKVFGLRLSDIFELFINFLSRFLIMTVLGCGVGVLLWCLKYAPMDWAGILLISFLAYPSLRAESEK